MAQPVTRQMIENLSIFLDTYSDVQLTADMTVIVDRLYVVDPFTMEYRDYGYGDVKQGFLINDANVADSEAQGNYDTQLTFDDIFDGAPETP